MAFAKKGDTKFTFPLVYQGRRFAAATPLTLAGVSLWHNASRPLPDRR